MGIISSNRGHYDGPKPPTGPWKCRACGTEHLTPLEQGCPSCGAGTPEQAEQARRRGPQFVIPKDRILAETIDSFWAAEIGGYFTQDEIAVLKMLSEKARITVAVALAHYADHGDPNNEQLPRAIITAWARLISDSIVYAAPAAEPAPPAGD